MKISDQDKCIKENLKNQQDSERGLYDLNDVNVLMSDKTRIILQETNQLIQDCLRDRQQETPTNLS